MLERLQKLMAMRIAHAHCPLWINFEKDYFDLIIRWFYGVSFRDTCLEEGFNYHLVLTFDSFMGGNAFEKITNRRLPLPIMHPPKISRKALQTNICPELILSVKTWDPLSNQILMSDSMLAQGAQSKENRANFCYFLTAGVFTFTIPNWVHLVTFFIQSE